MANYSIEAELKANVSKYRKAIQTARDVTQRFKRESESVEDTELDADTKPLQRNIKKARKMMQTFTQQSAEKEIDADTTSFFRKAQQVARKSRDLARDRIVVHIDAEFKKFMNKMNRIATTMRSIGEVAGSTFMGGFISAIPALSPIIAVLTGGIGALASSFVAAGGAAGAFGIAAVGNAQKLAESMEEVNKVNEKIQEEKASLDPNQEKINELLNERKNILNSMSKAQRSAMEQVNKFKSAWSEFLEVTQEPVFQVFTAGLKTATTLLNSLKPIIQPVADVLTDLLNRFNAFAKTDQFKSFIDFFATRGTSAIANWGTIAGNVLNGFMELMKAFGPLGEDMEEGLIGMTEQFANWAAGLSESEAFNKFINFVKENTPKVMSLIGNLTTFIIELGKGMAPLGSKILDMANSFFSWINGLMQGNPIVGKLIALGISLMGVITTLTPIILLVGQAFTSVTKVISKIGPFFSRIGGAISKVLPFFKRLWMSVGTKLLSAFTRLGPMIVRIGSFLIRFTNPVGIVISIVIALATIIIKNWDKIWAWTKKTFSKIWNWLKSTWQKIKSASINAAIKIAKNVAKKFAEIRQAIVDKITAAWNFLKNIWSTIKSFIVNLLSSIVSAVINKFLEIVSNIRNKMQRARDLISNIWGSIKSFFSNIVGNIVSTVKNKFTDIVNSIRQKMKDALGKVKDIGGSILDFFGGLNLYDSGKAIIQSAIDGIMNMKDKIVGKVEGIVGRVRDLWPFSPAKRGPLKDIHKMDFAGPIGQSINRAKRPIMRASERLAATTRNAYNPKLQVRSSQITSSLRSLGRGSAAQVQSAVNADVQVQKQPIQIIVRNEADAEWIRTYVNEGNAIDSTINKF
ncbi:hypothetical protein GCM10007063_05520 [Lentibacillus kapialis]|uniref:Phage tail tape measure protein n=1 Tax=Lentibacillus kapialis TaxID=340214 RepID=A0A917PNC7_9BACI|nr:hypothetical protein [Lentibacillus kapialis]GGJ85938.1 hypothetical protein GCM10007063_05520 [Lentibacillus kapialis]